MKILHLSHLYDPSMGGCQIYMKHISEGIARLNENVTVFTPMAINVNEFTDKSLNVTNLPKEQTINGVNVKRFKIKHVLYKRIFQDLIKIKGGYSLLNTFFRDAIELLKFGPFIPQIIFSIIKLKPDVVVCLSAYYSYSYFCCLLRKFIKFPLVIIPSLRMEPSWEDDPMIGKIVRRADLVVPLTEHEKKILIEKGVDEKKIATIGCSVDINEFKCIDKQKFLDEHDLKDCPTVTFLGRKAKGKGPDTLIDAMKIVWQQFDDVRLILAGQVQDLQEELQQKIQSIPENHRHKLINIDKFTPEKRIDIYACTDIFVTVSEIDSFGIVYIEAWACGKPGIAARNTAPGTYIEDGKDGLLVDYGNVQQTAQAILRLLKDDDLRKILGENGRKKVLENYTVEVISKKYLEEYKKIVNATKK